MHETEHSEHMLLASAAGKRRVPADRDTDTSGSKRVCTEEYRQDVHDRGACAWPFESNGWPRSDASHGSLWTGMDQGPMNTTTPVISGLSAGADMAMLDFGQPYGDSTQLETSGAILPPGCQVLGNQDNGNDALDLWLSTFWDQQKLCGSGNLSIPYLSWSRD